MSGHNFEIRSGSVNEIPIPSRAALKSTHFAITTMIDGRRYQFNFYWNTRHRFYWLDIGDDGGDIVRQTYLRPGMDETIRGFNPSNREAPDARLFISQDGPKGTAVTPLSIGTKHSLVVMTGVVDD